MWIESHQELGRHPKLRRLARILRISLPTAVGHLHYLWWWACDFAQDGDLSRYDDADIADGALWEGDPAEFVSALMQAGFLDPDRKLHDWEDYAGRLIERRMKEAERKRQERAERRARMQGDPGTSTDCPQDVHRTSAAHPQDDSQTSGPNLTIPNLTRPNNSDQGSSSNNDSAAGETNAGAQVAASSEPREPPAWTVPPGWQELMDLVRREHLPWQDSRTVLELMAQRVEEQGADLVREAILLSIQAGKPNWRYAEAILDDWKAKGITTVDQARAEAVEWRRRRRTVDKPKETSKPTMARGFESLRRLMEVSSSDP